MKTGGIRLRGPTVARFTSSSVGLIAIQSLGMQPTIEGKYCLQRPGKMDKEWLAKAFAEQVHHLQIPSNDQGDYIAEVVNRLQPYKDIEAWAAKAATDLKK